MNALAGVGQDIFHSNATHGRSIQGKENHEYQNSLRAPGEVSSLK